MPATRRVLNTGATVSGWKTGLPGQGGGPAGSGGPSVLARVMDTISRGNYAMAEGTRQAAFTDSAHPSKVNMVGSPVGFAKGFISGLSGKKKTTFSDVLDQGGVKNSWVKGIGGFIGDVALDPTTYLTLGTGAIAKTAGKTAGKVAAETVFKAGRKGVRDLLPTGARAVVDARKAEQAMRAAAEGLKAAEVARVGGTTAKVLDASRIAARPVGKDVIQAGSRVTDLGKDLVKVGGKIPTVSEPFRYAAKATKAGRAAEEAASTAQKVAEAARGAETAGAAAGATRAAETVGTAARVTDVAGGAGRSAEEVLKPLADPAMTKTFGLKFAGKPIKGLQSEKLYQAGKGAQGMMRASKAGNLLGETFDVGHGLPPEVANLQRMSSGVGRQRVDEFAQEVHKVYSGISKEDQKLIRSSIQDGTWKTSLRPELLEPAERTVQMLHEMDNLATGSAKGAKNAAGDVSFNDIFPYKGADTPFERAPQNLVAQYDRVIRKHQYGLFIDEVNRRFPDAVHNQEVQRALHKTRDIFGVDGEVSAKWQFYMNSVQAPWKRWVTSYRPGFHVRNMLGDAFNAYLAGTRSKYFSQSGRVLAHESEDAMLSLGGRKFTTAEAERMYRKGGLETSFIETEVVGGKDRGIAHTVTQFGEKREKFTRMATFLDSMDRALGRGFSVDKAIEEASMRVRKYHFDYSALTPTERKLRTFIPFYTYTRKELPVILEHTLTTPGKMNRVPKATNAIQSMLGVQHDPNNPFPGLDEMLPEYLKDQNILQLGGNKVLAPGLPADMITQFSPRGFADTVSQGLTPLIKAPYELASGNRIGGGKQTQSVARYLLAQGMYGSMFRDSKVPLNDRLIALLTGSGYKNIQPK